MKNLAILGLFLLASLCPASAQVSGGAGAYRNNDGDSINALNIERAKRAPGKVELEDTSGATYIDAAVLMNVKADEYVAVFAIFAEGETPATAGAQMNATLAKFTASLDALGVAAADRNVDFISQSRVYGFGVETLDKPDEDGNKTVLTEKLSGFEMKKNLSIRFRDAAKVGDLVAAASNAGIFDLVKVDYIVKDAAAIRAQLQNQTMNIIRQKAALYATNLGVKLPAPTQVVADLPGVYYPIDQYDSYTAADSEKANLSYNRSRTTVISAHKSSSIYFNPLVGDGFDAVINPVILEPVVQFTTYIKVKFAPPKNKQNAKP